LAKQVNSRGGGFSAFMWGSILGSLAGAIIALFFAPRSGDELRQEIEGTAVDVRRRIEGDSVADSLAQGKAEARKLNKGGER
jgi:gas vesicle protein